MNKFHLAIPTNNIELLKAFYQKLGASFGRQSDQFLIINFFNHQVVAHLNEDECTTEPEMYPRHFGMVIETLEELESIYQTAKRENLKFFEEKFIRFKNTPEEHITFFLQDPSTNLIEFKWYKDPAKIFS